MLSIDSTLINFPSGHACLLYRSHKGSNRTNLTKSPTRTLSLDPYASVNPSWIMSSCMIRTPKEGKKNK